jgi:hypothetical protein
MLDFPHVYLGNFSAAPLLIAFTLLVNDVMLVGLAVGITWSVNIVGVIVYMVATILIIQKE